MVGSGTGNQVAPPPLPLTSPIEQTSLYRHQGPLPEARGRVAWLEAESATLAPTSGRVVGTRVGLPTLPP